MLAPLKEHDAPIPTVCIYYLGDILTDLQAWFTSFDFRNILVWTSTATGNSTTHKIMF